MVKKKVVRAKGVPVVQEVSLGADISKTENLGNYESRKFNVYVGYKRSVLPGETVEEAYDKLYETVENQLRARYTRMRELTTSVTSPTTKLARRVK